MGVSGKSIIQQTARGRGLGAGQGAGDGDIASPHSLPQLEGTQTLPSPQKEVMALRMLPARWEHTHGQSCTRMIWVSAPQGLLLEKGGGLWSANLKLLQARGPSCRVPPAL